MYGGREGGDLKLLASKIGRLQLEKTRLSGNTRRKPKSQAETREYRGHTASGACDSTQPDGGKDRPVVKILPIKVTS
jgi:hypothetical protein